MPELPEVEVIKRGLQTKLPGKIVKSIDVRETKILKSDPSILINQQVHQLRRIGKYLIIEFDRHHLLIHLRMTGQLTYWDASQPDSANFYRQKETGLQRAKQHPIDKHTHFIIHWSDGHALYYRDIRKFGRIECLTSEKLSQHPSLLSLGIEPFTSNYTMPNFIKLFKSSRSIKSLLLDQQAIAGLGNIYCDEALFLANIHPKTPTNKIAQPQRQALFKSILTVLEKGIEFGGTSLKDYIDSEGKKGSNQEKLFVYGRKGMPCIHCQSSIEKISLAQRGTHFCPTCQRFKG